jgi:hypothetical protein
MITLLMNKAARPSSIGQVISRSLISIHILTFVCICQAAVEPKDWDVIGTLKQNGLDYEIKMVPVNSRIKEERTMIVSISSVSPVLTYTAPIGYPDLHAQGTIIKCDTSDKSEMAKLKVVLSAYETYQINVVTEPRKEPDFLKEFLRTSKDYDGVLGETVIGATRPKESFAQPGKAFFEEAILQFGPKNEDQRNGINIKTVADPTALLYVLNHLDELRANHAEAVEAMQKRLAATSAAQDSRIKAEAKADIEAAKVAASQRVKEAENAANAQIARLNHQKTLDTIAQEEAAQIADVQRKLESTKRVKVSEYFASNEGKALVIKIQSKLKQVIAKESEEKAYINELEQKLVAFKRIMESGDLSISAAVRKYANDSYVSTSMRLSEAEANYKDSPELAKMRKELRELGARFEADCGVSYDEAIRIQAEVNKK